MAEMAMRGMNPLNPFEDEDDMNREHGDTEYYSPKIKDRLSLGKKIWDHDIDRVLLCDTILAWFPTLSIGTGIELWEASKNGKKLIIITDNPHPVFAKLVIDYGAKMYASIDAFMNSEEYTWS